MIATRFPIVALGRLDGKCFQFSTQTFGQWAAVGSLSPEGEEVCVRVGSTLNLREKNFRRERAVSNSVASKTARKQHSRPIRTRSDIGQAVLGFAEYFCSIRIGNLQRNVGKERAKSPCQALCLLWNEPIPTTGIAKRIVLTPDDRATVLGCPQVAIRLGGLP